MKYTWAIVSVLLCACAAQSPAVTPEEITHTTQADFAPARMEDVIVSSRGEVQLARMFRLRMEAGKGPVVVSKVAVAGDALYVASGNDNVVYKVTSDGSESFAQLPGAIVTSLLFVENRLLAGTGGAGKAGLYEIDPQGSVKTLWSDQDIKYVWAILSDGEGGFYVATGVKAGIWHVSKEKARRIYQVKEELADHLLCLARDAQGLLYAGSDKNGLVFQVAPNDGSGRVLLDAEEKEIAALAIDSAGGVFAATSDASKASADAPPEPGKEKTGKSDNVQSGQADGAEAQARKQEDANEQEARKPASPTPSRSTGAASSGPGNAVYYIHPNGMVETVFREKVTVLDMILQEGKLYLATGNDGRILRVDHDGDAHLPLVDTEARQATCLAVTDQGHLVFGTANPGSVGQVQAQLAREGTLSSEPIDAKQIATWGSVKASLIGAPQGGSVRISTRTGNLAQPDEQTWSDWSQPQELLDGRFLSLQSPAGRFFQYRLHFTGREGRTPRLSRLELIRQVGNLPPVVSAIKITPANKASGPPAPTLVYRMIEVSASDTNKDTLSVSLYFRPESDGPWIRLAQDLEEPKYAWDTRTITDGTYDLRAVVSDAPSNPRASAREAARISEPITVDNTAPGVKVQARKQEQGFTVTAEITDATSRLVSLAYSIDSQDDWNALLPTDGVADGRSENVEFLLDELDRGAHRIIVRGVDVYGNTGYGSAVVTAE